MTGPQTVSATFVPVPPPPPLWVMGYLTSYGQSHMPMSEVDYSAVTHIAHFSLFPNADGTLKPNVALVGQSDSLIAAAHAAGVRVLITIGGTNSAGQGLQSAITDAHRGALIDNIMGVVTSHGYDGVDLDMEPVADADASNYAATAKALRTRLDAVHPGMLLTAAAPTSRSAFFAPVAKSFDRINVMTYDMSAPYAGWVTWHQSALYTNGLHFSNGRPLPSCDLYVQQYIDSGVPSSKVGMGIWFHGKVWQGTTGPRQSIQGVTTSTVTYYDLMDKYYSDANHRWDAGPDASYLSDAANNRFISYDDAQSIAEKIRYAKGQKIGGVIVWDLASGYRAGLPAGLRNPLLDAIKAQVR